MKGTIAFLLAGGLVGAASPNVSLAPTPKPVAHLLTVTARDFAFEMPDTVAAGPTLVTLRNRGAQLHHFFLMRLEPGHSPQSFFAAMQAGGPPPAWTHNAGGPNAPAPGAESAALVSLTPGTYVAICVIPGPDGKPHIMKGMAKPFTVVAQRTGKTGPMPAADVQLTLADYGFTFSKALTAGHHVIQVHNTAAQPHEIFIGKLAPGKTAQDVAAWVDNMQGPPPILPLGGVSPLDKGETNDFVVDLTPGEYGVFCFVPDAKDGKPHVMHGMLQQFSVR